MSRLETLVLQFIDRCSDNPPMIEDISRWCWVDVNGASVAVESLRSMGYITTYSPLRMTKEGLQALHEAEDDLFEG